jgi:hypothetical protein
MLYLFGAVSFSQQLCDCQQQPCLHASGSGACVQVHVG